MSTKLLRMQLMVTGFNHSGLVVKNIKEMVAFYKNVLGLSVIRESKSVAPVEGDHTGFVGAERVLVFLGIQGDKHLLELVHYHNPTSLSGHLERNQLGASHIGFETNDLNQLYKTLKSKGVEFVTPPKFRRNDDGSYVGVCYARDPEGNWIEFIDRR
mgnify:CR=1 FL=1